MGRLVRRPGVWLAIAALVAVAGVQFMRWRGPAVRVAHPARRDLEQHIVSSGRVRVPTRVQISAQTSGLVVAVGAVEGQHVKPGELLVQLDDAAERAAVAQAGAALNQARARVDQLKRVGAIVATEALRQAQHNLEHAQADLARTRTLAASGAVTPASLEDAQHAVDIAQAQRTAAEAQQVASAPLGADSRIALTQLLQAEALLSAAKVRLAQTRLVALQSGTVLARSVEPGDVVQPARVLLVFAADAAVQLVFQPDERNLAFIQLGQRARASADAYPQQVFDAVVSYIAPSIDPQRGSIEVRLEVPSPPPTLKPEMTVSIDLTVARRPHALTVPSAAVHGAALPKPWVQTVERGRVVRREVELGIRGEGATEILRGLDETSAVILPDGQQLPEGAHVRAEAG